MADAWGFFGQNDRKNIKLTRGNIGKRKNLYLCAFVKNKDTRTEEHKANAMNFNKIEFHLSTHYVFLSKSLLRSGVFFRQNEHKYKSFILFLPL